MNQRRWDEIRAVFDEIVELEHTERASRLAAISTTDPELREAVDVLLRADADADAWLAPVESPLDVAGWRAHSRRQPGPSAASAKCTRHGLPDCALSRRIGLTIRTKLTSVMASPAYTIVAPNT